MIDRLLKIAFVAIALWTLVQAFGQGPNPPIVSPKGPGPMPTPAGCIVVKPHRDCAVMEQEDFDKANLSAEQRKAAGGAMVPNDKRGGKLRPGDLYYATSNGDLVKATVAQGVYVDDAKDPSNPVVRFK